MVLAFFGSLGLESAASLNQSSDSWHEVLLIAVLAIATLAFLVAAVSWVLRRVAFYVFAGTGMALLAVGAAIFLFQERPNPEQQRSFLNLVLPISQLQGRDFWLFVDDELMAIGKAGAPIPVSNIRCEMKRNALTALLILPNDRMRREWTALTEPLVSNFPPLPLSEDYRSPFVVTTLKWSGGVAAGQVRDVRLQMPDSRTTLKTPIGWNFDPIPPTGDLERLQWVARVQHRLESEVKKLDGDPVVRELRRLDRLAETGSVIADDIGVYLPPDFGGPKLVDRRQVGLLVAWIHMHYFGWFPAWERLERSRRAGNAPKGINPAEELFRRHFGADRAGEAMARLVSKVGGYLDDIDKLGASVENMLPAARPTEFTGPE